MKEQLSRWKKPSCTPEFQRPTRASRRSCSTCAKWRLHADTRLGASHPVECPNHDHIEAVTLGIRKQRVQSRALGLGSAQFVAILAHNLVSACSRHLTKVEQLRLGALVGSRYSDVEDGSLHVFMCSFFHPLTLCFRQPV